MSAAVLLCLASLARAQSETPADALSADGALPPDVRLVIDVSGSMKRNDPNNLRQPAVDLLVKLLPDNSKAGVWTFGRWVNMLVKHRPVDEAWRQDALANSEQINSAGLFTNIGEALEKAAYDLPQKDKTHRSSIILLTDGMVDIDKDPAKNTAEWRRIVDEILPRLREAGIAVHTIALSDNADTDLLNKLSLGTDGLAAVAKTADELMKIFLRAFEVAAPMEEVPLSDQGFVIDSSVEEFTALIFRQNPAQETQLIGPDNEKYAAASTDEKYMRWHRDSNYDLITVKQPLEGQWQVIADMDPESRITVVSNLNLRVKPLPNNIMKDQSLELSFLLSEDGKTLTSPEFLSLMDIRASMTAGRDEFDLKDFWQTKVQSKTPPDKGVFSLALPDFSQEGIYQLTLVVDGKSFVREFTHQFATRQPFGAQIEEQLQDGETRYLLSARAYSTDVNVDKTQVIATLTLPDDRKKVIPLSATALDTWQTTIRPEREGTYSALIRTRGVYNDGSEFDIEIEPLTFNYSISAGFVEDEKPFELEPTPSAEPEPEPEAEPTQTQAPAQDEQESPADSAEAIPAWMLYLALGLGNLLLFGLGFLAYKKIMGGASSESVLEQFSEEQVAEQTQNVESSVEADPEIDVEEEEPPMEDIDPAAGEAIDEELSASSMTTVVELDEAPPVESSEDTKKEDELKSTSEQSSPGIADEPVVAEVEAMEALDDLDQMAVDAQREIPAEDTELQAEADTEDDDDDMVAAMLKAQGLDLAEDELDDAISSLIDELENEGVLNEDDGKDKKKK